MTTTGVLQHYHPELDTRIETDTSDGVVARVLSQKGPNDEQYYPVEYFSKSLKAAETSYAVHDKDTQGVTSEYRTKALLSKEQVDPQTIEELEDDSEVEEVAFELCPLETDEAIHP